MEISSRNIRTLSAGQGNNSMRDTINRLHQELLHSKAETQRVSEQLSCMMILVKRAWQGDQKSAVDVANIVGIAPPDFEQNGSFSVITTTPKQVNGDPLSFVMKSKSRSVNNWAVFTIGLLNRHYKAAEEQEVARQQYYLHSRQAYLDEQLIYHKHLQMQIQAQLTQEAQQELIQQNRVMQQSLRTHPQNLFTMIDRSNMTTAHAQIQHAQTQHAHTQLKRSNSYSGSDSIRRVKSASSAERSRPSGAFITQNADRVRPQSSKPSTAKKPLFRPNPAKQNGSQLSWGDLVIDPTINRFQAEQPRNTSVYKLDKQSSNPAARQRRLSYDDPQRYNTSGLFNVEDSVLQDTHNKPINAQAQKDSDTMRARPRSAVHVPGERSLKYEVVRPTRPQSSSTTTNKSKTTTRRPPSGKKSNQSKQQQQQQQMYTHVIPNVLPSNDNNDRGDIEEENEYVDSERTDRVVYDEAAFKKLGIDLDELEREQRVPPMKINIKKPQSVIDFESDVDFMHSMENEITRNALALQKRLGLNSNGLL